MIDKHISHGRFLRVGLYGAGNTFDHAEPPVIWRSSQFPVIVVGGEDGPKKPTVSNGINFLFWSNCSDYFRGRAPFFGTNNLSFAEYQGPKVWRILFDQLLGFVLFKPSIFDLRWHKVDCKHYTIDIRFTQLIRWAVRRFRGFLDLLLHRRTTICTTFSKARTREKCWQSSKSKNAPITMKGFPQLVTTSLGPPYFSCFFVFFFLWLFSHIFINLVSWICTWAYKKFLSVKFFSHKTIVTPSW